MDSIVETLKMVALIWLIASILFTIAWIRSGFGTPDDDEIGGDQWPRLDDHR